MMTKNMLKTGTSEDFEGVPTTSSFRALFGCWCLGLVTLAATGCGTTQVRMDAVQLRDVIMDAMEDQIMDNVIRTKNELPIVHFDYSKINAGVTSKLAGSVQGGQTLANTSSTTLTNNTVTTGSTSMAGKAAATVSRVVAGTVGVAATATQVATRPLTFSLAPERSNVLAVEMDPVTSHNEVYEAYESFVSSYDGDSIRDSQHFPIPGKNPQNPEDAVHVGRYWRGTYYWVPKKYSHAFFNLCLVAAVKRGGPPKTDSPTHSQPKSGSGSSSNGKTNKLPSALRSSSETPLSIKSPDVKALEDTAHELRLQRLTPP